MIDKEKLAVRRIIENKLDDCVLYIIEDNDGKTYLLFVYRNYFKIMPEYPGKWNCEEALYHPYGLFGFLYENTDLTEKVKKKLEALKNAGL
ncbi:hypothetical protein DFR86_03330 [Acidianus sulfidivorans JP7]|uniref:Uncharacterized protein n=1 Tax=Acidianus sulfidivorans JP7 TaxID=619593 RepID=A0A2U9IKZ4_9CREN|nr:hypothetical protein [Acidianus sulfidivorans]AWR96681.1 hypothetical protein DFR86_03330 [Acidianus sulfidivorans JP7]